MKYQDGFTLVEMLVALALFAITSVLIASAVSTGVFSWQVASGDRQIAERQRALSGLFEGLITSSVPLRYQTGEDSSAWLEVSPNRLRFAAPALDAFGTPSLTIYEFEVDGGGEPIDEIRVRWCPVDRCRTPSEFRRDASADVIPDVPANIRFSTFEPLRERDGMRRGQSAEALSGYLHLSWQQPGSGDEIVHLFPLGADDLAPCLFDPVSRGCRRSR